MTTLVEGSVLEVNTEWGIISIQQTPDDVPREEDFDLVLKSGCDEFWLINFKPYDNTLRDFDILLKSKLAGHTGYTGYQGG